MRVPRATVEYNLAKWVRMGFGSVGEMHISRTAQGWRADLHVEGTPANEPSYVEHVRQQFDRFVAMGWGLAAWGHVDARVLAGAQERGPAAQWVSIPTIGM